jgi:superfamily II DNA or RNA helicase
VIDTYKQRWGKGKTLLFAVDCAHAQMLQARFHDAGISCAYQDAHTSSADRAAIKRGFHSGQYQVVANVGTLTTGVDWDVRCLILARPTKSEMLFVQIIGRSLRTADGKDHALILDHTDTTARLGFVTDIHHEHLDGGKLDSNKKAAPRGPALPKPCLKCAFLIPPGLDKCPECGNVRKVQSKVFERDGQLVEMTGRRLADRSGKRTNNKLFPYSREEKMRFYQQLRGYGMERDYKPGWAAVQFKEKFGEWPERWWDTHPWMTAGAEVRNYARSRAIAWARSRQGARST